MRWLLLAATVALLSGCGSENNGRGAATLTSAPAPAARNTDAATIDHGLRLYRQHCATCHGSEGQGAPNWQQVGPDGKWPAPPLNGTGHAWHHPQAALVQTIQQGTLGIGGNMPAWRSKLSNTEIEAIIVWFQSRWPDELYQAWARMDQQSRQK